jgi:hypothetical protein
LQLSVFNTYAHTHTNEMKQLVIILMILSHKAVTIRSAATIQCPKSCSCDLLRRHMECECANSACKTSIGENSISFKKQKMIYDEIRINDLDYIDTNIFWQTSATKNTKIFLNMVSYITRNSFNFASLIETIEITYENMAQIEPNGFSGLRCDQLVLVSTEKNYRFNINIFNEKTKIRNLVLSYMSTNYLENAFQADSGAIEFSVEAWTSRASVQILEILELRCNTILDETWAPKFKNLRTIFIYRTDIQFIHKNFLNLHANTLKHLILRENKIEILGAHMFADFSNLVLLDLSDNPIKFIHVNAFFGLEKLQSLDLQGKLQ